MSILKWKKDRKKKANDLNEINVASHLHQKEHLIDGVIGGAKDGASTVNLVCVCIVGRLTLHC